MPRSMIALGRLIAAAALVTGCSLAAPTPPGESLAERVRASGGGYVFEPHPLPDGAMDADAIVGIVRRYGRQFVVQRMAVGQLRPNVAGPAVIAYVVEVVDGGRTGSEPALMLIDAETGEILAAPGTS